MDYFGLIPNLFRCESGEGRRAAPPPDARGQQAHTRQVTTPQEASTSQGPIASSARGWKEVISS